MPLPNNENPSSLPTNDSIRRYDGTPANEPVPVGVPLPSDLSDLPPHCDGVELPLSHSGTDGNLRNRTGSPRLDSRFKLTGNLIGNGRAGAGNEVIVDTAVDDGVNELDVVLDDDKDEPEDDVDDTSVVSSDGNGVDGKGDRGLVNNDGLNDVIGNVDDGAGMVIGISVK